MKFLVTNQAKAANILEAVDYLRVKFLQGEEAHKQKHGKGIQEINSDFTDETGQHWRLALTRVPAALPTSLPTTPEEVVEVAQA